MKRTVKILSVFCCVILVAVSFSLTAYADPLTDLILDFLLNWSFNTYNSVCDDNKSASDIVDWASGQNGSSYLAMASEILGSCGTLNSPVLGIDGKLYKNNPFRIYEDVQGDVGTAKAGEYKVAKVTQDFVDKSTNALNGFYNSGRAELRNLGLADLGLTTYGNIESNWGSYSTVNGADGNGLYPFMKYKDSNYLLFQQGDVKNNTVSIFNGDSNFPPVICVPSSNLLYQNNIALPAGCYIVLNSSELYYVKYVTDDFYLTYVTGSTASDINVYYQHGMWGGQRGLIYFRGSSTVTNGDVTGYDTLDKLVKSVGIVIETEDYKAPETTPFVPQDVTSFADPNGYVICLVPCDSQGEVVYMSDDTFNDYINNGTIVNDDSITNNIVDDETVNNFGDVINNYITNNNTTVNSTYDDSNLISKLSSWFGDVNKNLKKIIKLLGDDGELVEPCYDNFSDCFDTAFPIIGQVKQVLNNFQSALSSDVSKSPPELSKTPNSSGFSPNNSYDITIGIPVSDAPAVLLDNGFTSQFNFKLDYDLYEPYRLQVRTFLSIIFCIICLSVCWKSVKSLFNISGDIITNVQSPSDSPVVFLFYDKTK